MDWDWDRAVETLLADDCFFDGAPRYKVLARRSTSLAAVEKMSRNPHVARRFAQGADDVYVLKLSGPGTCGFCDVFAVELFQAGCKTHTLCEDCAYAWCFVRSNREACVASRFEMEGECQ